MVQGFQASSPRTHSRFLPACSGESSALQHTRAHPCTPVHTLLAHPGLWHSAQSLHFEPSTYFLQTSVFLSCE